MSLRRAVAACHLLLIGALAAALLPPFAPLRFALALALVSPLLLTLRGLVRARLVTLQRLAVLLVAYVGGTSVEVVAQAGDARMASVALLAAVLELGLLLALIRRSARAAPGARE
jgi:hypothetical protein